MPLTKVTYVDNVTVISASNLNAIQDAIIALEGGGGGGGGGSISTPIQKSDLASDVQTSLGKADTALQPISGKGLSTNDYTNTDKSKVDQIKNVAYLEYEVVEEI